MAGRIGIDFGTSNTVVAVWNGFVAEPLFVPDYGRMATPAPNIEPTPSIPSLIHYEAQRQWIGNQVLQRNLQDSPRTFRWMKRYIAQRSPRTITIDGQPISAQQAGRDFLSAVILSLRAELGLSDDEEIACTTPVEAYEHYENWLLDVAQAAGFVRLRLIDEPSAAALGYGVDLQPARCVPRVRLRRGHAGCRRAAGGRGSARRAGATLPRAGQGRRGTRRRNHRRMAVPRGTAPQRATGTRRAHPRHQPTAADRVRARSKRRCRSASGRR
jgi:hypothetical protein